MATESKRSDVAVVILLTLGIKKANNLLGYWLFSFNERLDNAFVLNLCDRGFDAGCIGINY